MLKLHVTPAQGDSFFYDVESDELIIGRSMKADLSVADRFLSRRHAQLYRSDDSWMIEDMGSRNGTFVNGARVNAPTVVSPGDVITMSASTITVSAHGEAQPAAGRREILDEGSVFRPATELIEASTHLPPPTADPEADPLVRTATSAEDMADAISAAVAETGSPDVTEAAQAAGAAAAWAHRLGPLLEHLDGLDRRRVPG